MAGVHGGKGEQGREAEMSGVQAGWEEQIEFLVEAVGQGYGRSQQSAEGGQAARERFDEGPETLAADGIVAQVQGVELAEVKGVSKGLGAGVTDVAPAEDEDTQFLQVLG